MNGHGIDVCACGAVISQCRCFDHNERRVVQQNCEACRKGEYIGGVVEIVSGGHIESMHAGAVHERKRIVASLSERADTLDAQRKRLALPDGAPALAHPPRPIMTRATRPLMDVAFSADEETVDAIQRAARLEQMSVSAWLRATVREALKREGAL